MKISTTDSGDTFLINIFFQHSGLPVGEDESETVSQNKSEEEPKSLKCGFCTDCFTSSAEILKHCNNAKTGHKFKIISVKCIVDGCKEVFKSEQGLKGHLDCSKHFDPKDKIQIKMPPTTTSIRTTSIFRTTVKATTAKATTAKATTTKANLQVKSNCLCNRVEFEIPLTQTCLY